MEINILNRNTISAEEIEKSASESAPALDDLWASEWINASITHADEKLAEELTSIADEIAEVSDIVVVAADGKTAKSIKAALALTEDVDARPEVIVFGDTLSTEDYGELISKLRDKRASLLAVAAEKESLQFTGAYTILKKLIISSGAGAELADRIYAICSGKSTLVAKDCAENDYPVVWLSDKADSLYLANTAAALLPLLIKGVSLEEYLKGFYEIVSAPDWDINATIYSWKRAEFEKNTENPKVNYMCWQREFFDVAKWLESFDSETEKRVLFMPEDEYLAKDRENNFDVLLGADESLTDIMTPFFEGCGEDGSLALLTKETADRKFFGEDRKSDGFKIELNQLDDFAAGRVMAFLQISEAIVTYLTNK